ncbi:hypothetical protein N1031_02390 [Herbiconiux moechotypicola]|uniref:AbiEi antitoxin C-terminal domain-containing protein n=1 Tax=Herbiconiux moechotypicola TaxID=637393 RepID=A0ABP5Q277_9MICO|nr:hypothetical protein [Herbiconiux moechotypicola]MCS5728597.1 hypothetical protein [Herbiconiux moechotypicola]
MTPRLPLLLDSSDLPLAELHAARLDGELAPLDELFLPTDLRAGPGLRGEALQARVPPGHVVERLTAAWVHGATPLKPRRLQLCIDGAHRARVRPSAGELVRQVTLRRGDTEQAGPLRVTTAHRTALDLLRTGPPPDGAARRCIATLVLAAEGGADGVREALTRSFRVPHTRRALARLDELL